MSGDMHLLASLLTSASATYLLPDRPPVITLSQWDAATPDQRDAWLAQGAILRDARELMRRVEARS